LAFIVAASASVGCGRRRREIRELARNDSFNEYFRKQFNGNEATYLRWKEVFDVLEIDGGRGIYYTVRESME